MNRTALHLVVSLRVISFATIAIALAHASGCASRSKPPPLTPPALTSQVQYRPTATTTTQPTKIDTADALRVEVAWTALAEAPKELPPLLSNARVIETPAQAEPIRATGQLTRAAQYVPPEQIDKVMASIESGGAAKSAKIASTRAVLPKGVTATFAMHAADARVPMTFEVSRAAPTTAPTIGQEQMLCALTLNGPAGHERLLLTPLALTPPARFGVVTPSQSDGPSRAMLSVITLEPLSDPASEQAALAQCEQDLQQHAAIARAAATTAPIAAANLQAALASLARPHSTRRSLAYLANETNAQLAGDVALAADDATLAELAGRINTRLKTAKLNEPNAPQLAWELEAACMEQLAAMQTAEKLPPELAAPLSVFAGEAGRRSASLDELVQAGSVEALRAKVIAENFNYLEDSSPASRVRAYDWLVASGQQLAGYDPLADARQRRAALDRAITAAAKVSGGAP